MIFSRLKATKWLPIIVAIDTLVAALPIPPGPILAGHGDVSLEGSDFEIDAYANLIQDHFAPPEGGRTRQGHRGRSS